MSYPATIKLWLELVLPAKPSIEFWEPLSETESYYRIKLTTGEVILLRQNGTELTTWRY